MPASFELRALRAPAATYRELAASDGRGAWMLVRRPLLLMLAMGVVLSLGSSPRVSLRAVVDGMISFAFLPLAEAIAVGVVYLQGERRVPFTRVVDAFPGVQRPVAAVDSRVLRVAGDSRAHGDV